MQLVNDLDKCTGLNMVTDMRCDFIENISFNICSILVNFHQLINLNVDFPGKQISEDAFSLCCIKMLSVITTEPACSLTHS